MVGARLLPPEELGSAAVGQTIGMIAALVANGGLNISTIYLLQQRRDERRAIVPALVAMAVAACVVAIVLVLVSAPVVLGLVVEESSWPLMLTAATMGATVIAFEFAGALLLGLGNARAFTILELVRGWGSLVAVTSSCSGRGASDGGLVARARAWDMLPPRCWGWPATNRSGMSLRPRVDRELTGTALAFGLRGQVGNVFQFLGVRLDLLLVPALLDMRAAGIYFIAVRMSDVVGQAATAASSLIFPQVAGQEDRRDTALTERATRIILLVVAGSALVLGLLGDFILRTAFGAVYGAGTSALLVLLVAMLPLSVAHARGRPEGPRATRARIGGRPAQRGGHRRVRSRAHPDARDRGCRRGEPAGVRHHRRRPAARVPIGHRRTVVCARSPRGRRPRPAHGDPSDPGPRGPPGRVNPERPRARFLGVPIDLLDMAGTVHASSGMSTRSAPAATSA